MFGFEKKAYFEAEEGSEKAPKVEFLKRGNGISSKIVGCTKKSSTFCSRSQNNSITHE